MLKKFILKCITFALILGVIFIPFSMFIDPFNVFHVSAPRNNGVEPNKNYLKMHNVLYHPDKYDSFLFGSSRVGFIDVEKMNDGVYYDMMYSEGTPAEHYDNISAVLSLKILLLVSMTSLILSIRIFIRISSIVFPSHGMVLLLIRLDSISDILTLSRSPSP